MKLQTLKPRLQIERASSKNNWGSGRGGRPWRRPVSYTHL
ncbi:HNH endonuclease, partial [Acinetobacter baumannii]